MIKFLIKIVFAFYILINSVYANQIKDVIIKGNDRISKQTILTYGQIKIDKVYETNDLASGEVMFAATGVTDGTFLKGVLIKNDYATTHSVVMRSKTGTIRYINANHNLNIKKYRSYFK